MAIQLNIHVSSMILLEENKKEKKTQDEKEKYNLKNYI